MKKKEKEILTVGIVEKKYFSHRVVSNDIILGEYMYDFYIDLLQAIGKEIKSPVHFQDVRLFTQVESSHKVRYFEVSKEAAIVLEKYCAYNMQKALNKFAVKMRRQGTNILMQLNNGELSMKDIEEAIEKTH